MSWAAHAEREHATAKRMWATPPYAALRWKGVPWILHRCVKRVRCTANEKCNATKHRNTKYIYLLERNNAVARTRDCSVALSLTLSFAQRSSVACDCVESWLHEWGSGATFVRRLALAQARRHACRTRANASMEKERISRWHSRTERALAVREHEQQPKCFVFKHFVAIHTRYY